MKYLMVIMLFIFSCTQIDRVESGEYVNSKKTVQKVKLEEISPIITPIITPKKEGGYEDMKCGKVKYCVKKIRITQPNKYNITRVWIQYYQLGNGSIMEKTYSGSVRIFVSTGSVHDEEWYKSFDNVSVDNIEKYKEKIMGIAENKMYEIIYQILSKPLENE
jgi:hypothetical protein